MAELDALAAELRRKLPKPTERLLNEQRTRLLADPRARIPSVTQRVLPSVLVLASALMLLVVWLARPGVEAPTEPWTFSASDRAVEQALEDGTTVRLEPGARGRIAERGATVVRFELERGSAGFQVVPQRGRRFTVVAGAHEISVLGTSFVVHFDPPNRLLVSVEQGLVAVRASGGSELQLGPGARFTVGDWPSVAQGLASAGMREAAAPPTMPGTTEPGGTPLEATATKAEDPEAAAARSRANPVRSSAPAAGSWSELYRRGDYHGALSAARLAGFERLVSELSAQELANLADAARLAGRPAEALRALQALERRFPTTQQGREARFLSGRVLLQSGNASGAISAFELYLARSPDGPYSTEATGRLLELYTQRGDTARAREMARRYLVRAPQGAYQRLARSVLESP